MSTTAILDVQGLRRRFGSTEAVAGVDLRVAAGETVAGEMFLRVGVLDGVSDKVGTMEIPLTVHKKSAAAAAPGGKGGD